MAPAPKKSRDTLISETTDRLLGDWLAELRAGGKRVISDLHNTMLDRLTSDDCKALFIQAATDKEGADASFGALVVKTMTDVCAADAERIADILLGDLRASAEDDRISRVFDAKAA